MSRIAHKLDGTHINLGNSEDKYEAAYGRLKELLAFQNMVPALERKFSRADRRLGADDRNGAQEGVKEPMRRVRLAPRGTRSVRATRGVHIHVETPWVRSMDEAVPPHYAVRRAPVRHEVAKVARRPFLDPVSPP